MAHMGYKNFREPVVYILDQELRKRNFKNQINTNEDSKYIGELPEYPCRIIRDSNNKAYKFIYANGTDMQWQEELIRNAEGKVYRIKTTHPNNTNKTIQLIKDNHGKLETIDYV
ncbi:hypothetical protein EXN65_13075 [Clostridium botulinum]|uniref:hypothetical protein n=1 Tax=Clostridium botulinum TaxID=1491 RepID=UPI00016BC051|nr:hypothetical protein [Clostridium botulinum]EDT87165.1 conserved hypothetical protein [Clostridium botulinum Bf]MBY6881335.1 hypothetical protein [Clostridium botulinum]NEZ85047.1 hypothetical protein [Clostridium botulinum]NFB00192.1 hypothetical protein [Clostridium botulinum]NFB30279.1 hypothetical protein [Clostridium botulinum]